MFIDSLLRAKDKTDWVTYLVNHDEYESQSELMFFERCVSCLSPEKQKRVFEDIEHGDCFQVESKLYELLISHLFYHLNSS